MKSNYIVFMLLGLVSLTGCTKGGVYDQAYRNQKQECVKRATTPQEVERCDAEYNDRMKFDEYERQRKAVSEPQ